MLAPAVLALPAGAEPLPAARARSIALADVRAAGAVEGEPQTQSMTEREAMARLMGGDERPPSGTPLAGGLSPDALVQVVTLHGHFHFEHSHPRGEPVGGTVTAVELVLDSEGATIGRHLTAGGAAQASAVRRRSRARAATWDGGLCNNAPEYHCYDETRWTMWHSNEMVRASETQMETTAMTAPLSGSPEGSFVSNEKWTGFPQSPEDRWGHWWFEDGQEAGYPHGSEHQMYWFVAWNNSSGYGEWAPGGWPEEGWVFNDYQTVSHLNGEWVAYVNGGWAGAVGGLYAYAKQLTVGAEYATPSGPVNTFNEQSNYTAVNGLVHTWPEAQAETEPHTCQTRFSREYPPHYYPGNVTGWTPC